MIADYFLLRRGILSVDDLYRRGGSYEYSGGVNWVAITAFVVGVAPSLPGFIGAVSGRPASAFFGGVYNWAWFVGFLVSAGVYILGMRVMAESREKGAVRAGA
jgi:NCS1 family nucleobase:cation symporter-1